MECIEGERPNSVTSQLPNFRLLRYTTFLTAMNAEDLVIDDNAESQKVEHIREIVPDVCVSILA